MAIKLILGVTSTHVLLNGSEYPLGSIIAIKVGDDILFALTSNGAIINGGYRYDEVKLTDNTTFANIEDLMTWCDNNTGVTSIASFTDATRPDTATVNQLYLNNDSGKYERYDGTYWEESSFSDLTVPATPAGITPAAGDTQISVGFTGTVNAATYQVQASDDNFATIAGSNSGLGLTIVISSLVNGTAYLTRVRGVSTRGIKGGWRTAGSAVTPAVVVGPTSGNGWEGTPFTVSSSPAAVLGNVGFDTIFLNTTPAGYVASGFAPSYSSNDLVISAGYFGGAAFQFTNTNYVTLAEKSRTTLLFKMGAPLSGGGEYGIGISFASINPNGYAFNRAGYFYLRDSGAPGTCNFQDNFLGSVIGSTGSAIPITTNEEYSLVVERNVHSLTITVTNLTTPASTTATYSTTPDTPPGMSNASKLQITSIGSNVFIHEFKYEVLEKNNLNLLLGGNSETYGQAATSDANRYASLLDVPAAKMGVMGNGADGLLELQAGIAEVVALAPKVFGIMMGGNDLLFGIASATWQAAYDSICNTLRTAGIKIIHFCPFPRNAHSVLPLVSYQRTTYQQDLIVTNTYYDMRDGTTDAINPAYAAGDSLPHPNDTGMADGASLINTALADAVPSILI